MIITVMRTLKLLDATIYSSLLNFEKYHRISMSTPYWIMQVLTFVAMAWDCLGVYGLVLHSHNNSCNANRAVSLLWVVVLSSTLALLKRFLGFALWFLVRPSSVMRRHVITRCMRTHNACYHMHRAH